MFVIISYIKMDMRSLWRGNATCNGNRISKLNEFDYSVNWFFEILQ